jgi:hypothetical protein
MKKIKIPDEILGELLFHTIVDEVWDAGFTINTQDNVGKNLYFSGYFDEYNDPIFSYEQLYAMVYTSETEAIANIQLEDRLSHYQLNTKPVHFIH